MATGRGAAKTDGDWGIRLAEECGGWAGRLFLFPLVRLGQRSGRGSRMGEEAQRGMRVRGVR